MSYSSPRLGCRRVETPIFLPPGDAISAIINGFWADTRTSSRPAPPSKRRFRLCAYSLLFLLPWFFTNPLSAVPCAYTLTPLTATTAYTAGTGSVIVSGSPSGCTGSWTAVSWSALFTSSPTPVSGSGSASVQVNFSYGANPNATSRVGSINFYASGASFPSGSSYTMTQNAAPGGACIYTLTPLTATTAYTAGTGSVIVSGSPSGCIGSWTAVSWSALFTSSPTPVSGSGSASVQVNFSYGANPNATSRVGSINFYASGGASFPSGSSYTLTQDAAPGQSTTFIIPSTAHSPGANGAFYTSNVTVTNLASTGATFSFKFLNHDMDGRSGPTLPFSLSPGSSIRYMDVLGTVFSQVNAYGAIQVQSSSQSLVVQVETTTPAACSGGAFGDAMAALGQLDYVSFGTSRSIPGIEEDDAFRSNLILTNATESSLDIQLRLYGANGALLGVLTPPTFQPLEMRQISRIAGAITGNSLTLGTLVIQVDTPGGSVASFLSRVDNLTNDPRTLLPR